ncbi:MAG: transcription-repair coupling factor [Chloroflexi bacterium]|nr:transcription-repair coupling factor [Chloroflexota bacterium]
MDLTKLLPLIEKMPAYRHLLEKLRGSNSSVPVAVLEAAKPYLIAALFQSRRVPVLVVTAHSETSRKLYEQLPSWCPPLAGPVKLLPELDVIPYERVASDISTEIERLQVLSSLASLTRDGESTPNIPLIVASSLALMPKVIAHNDFMANSFTIQPAQDIEPRYLMGRLEALGYQIESIVEVPGTAAHRGGIIDIYPVSSPSHREGPVRLEFFGNTVESIRLFDPTTQLSVKSVPLVVIEPATELLAPRIASKVALEKSINGIDLSNCTPEMREQFQQELALLLDRQHVHHAQFYSPLFNNDSLLSYLPENTLVIIDGPERIRGVLDDFDAEASQLRREKVEQGELPHNFPTPYFTWTELEDRLKHWQRLQFITLGDIEADQGVSRLNFSPAPSYAGQMSAFLKKLKQRLSQKQRLIAVTNQAPRLSELLHDEDVIVPVLTEIKDVPPPGSLLLLQGSLDEGWVMNGNIHLFTDKEIFGFTKQRRLLKKRPVAYHKFLAELTPGDYVVHVEHGVARFSGVTTMRNNGTAKEYLVLQYAAGDKLYVPTDQIDRVSRYVGTRETPPVLTRLGSLEWVNTKRKVKESTEKIARELLDLYARREVVPGFSFSPDTTWQWELENSFPYVETPDQLEVVKEVKQDMEKPKPMDRLVCGDVGYGKTEIAIRAAFKAVLDNKQVAVLVPTTVLAQQHFTTFSQRLAAFPVKIEVLSRFRSTREQKSIIEGLADGTVDIVIGTHRLLQKDVRFKDLGLLVIDEEQRFGVAHKEYLKKLRQSLDVLALSATPSPRTLHMSLVGVRDMSAIETPPEDRLPIKTYVAIYNERLVREAILRELERDGQVFFVHNRVQSIEYVANRLQDLVPEAKVVVAHGQMDEDKLEKVMADFTAGKANVLVCTTIIESGLDMPNANTLIINKADKLGLTQLYQLRGRIGRGTELAYAYLLYDKEKRLTPTAEKRLRTIFEATELGSGFNIAMRDLEIRGAGTLLGVRQSGHINAVGFTLYTQLLAEAVEQLKAQQAGREVKPARLPPPTVDLALTAFIPEDYVTDLPTRLGFYQRLAKLDKLEQVDSLAQEFHDRFGSPPIEVQNLLYAVRVKLLAAKAGVASVTREGDEVVLRLIPGMEFTPRQRKLLFRDGVRLGTSQLRLDLKRLGERWQKTLEEVLGRVVV